MSIEHPVYSCLCFVLVLFCIGALRANLPGSYVLDQMILFHRILYFARGDSTNCDKVMWIWLVLHGELNKTVILSVCSLLLPSTGHLDRMMCTLDSSNELTGGLSSKQAIYRLYKDVHTYLYDIEVLCSLLFTILTKFLICLHSPKWSIFNRGEMFSDKLIRAEAFILPFDGSLLSFYWFQSLLICSHFSTATLLHQYHLWLKV